MIAWLNNATAINDSLDEKNADISNGCGFTDSIYFQIIYCTLLLLIFLVSMCGGLFVCYVIRRNHLMKKQIWIFLFALALSDIATSLCTIPVFISASIDEYILSDKWICQLNGFTMIFLFTWSIYTLVGISLEKYITISRPMESLLKKRYSAVIFFASVTIISLILASGPLLGFSGYTYRKCRKWCVLISSNRNHNSAQLALFTVFLYLLPVFILVMSNVRIYVIIRRQIAVRMRISNFPLNRALAEQEVVLRTVTILLLSFAICWTPALIMVIIGMSGISVPVWYSHFVHVFILSQGAVDPIVYCFRHAVFKNHLKRMLRRRTMQHHVFPESRKTQNHARTAMDGKYALFVSNPQDCLVVKNVQTAICVSSTRDISSQSPPSASNSSPKHEMISNSDV